jgi:hypothetical protein
MFMPSREGPLILLNENDSLPESLTGNGGMNLAIVPNMIFE